MLPRLLGFENLEQRDLLATVTLDPTADNSIFQESVNNSNGSGVYLFSGQAAAGAQVRRALLKFDVAGSVPAGSQIQSVTLQLHVSKTRFNAPPENFGLNRLTKDWGEGASNASGEEGIGAPATAGDATWSHRFFSNTAWAGPGGLGDFVGTPSDTTSVGGVDFYQWSSAQMRTDVQTWLDNPATQFGWMLKQPNETVEGSARRFDSRENPVVENRPALTITYTASNQPPTLDAIADPAPIFENAGQQSIGLTGITAGAGESQTLQVSAVSNNPLLIPDPTPSYTNPNTTGSLSYAPIAGKSGSATITVTVRDPGSDGTLGNSDDATVSQSFSVTVNPINHQPELDPISDPVAILEDAVEQTVNLSGIRSGDGSSQQVTVTASSNNTTLIPTVIPLHTNPNATGSLRYTPAANRFGTAVITVSVKDNGGTAGGGNDTITRTFTVTVSPTNDLPKIDAIPNPTAIVQDSGQQTINFTGVSAGPFETQTLDVKAESSNLLLIPSVAVNYTSANATGSLTYTPAPGQNGSAIVTVIVRDAGLNGVLGDGDDASVSTTFTVLVTDPAAINDPPSFMAGPNRAAGDNSGPVSFDGGATSISPGPPDEAAQTVSFLVSAVPSSLFSVQPEVDKDGKLTFTPAPNMQGVAVVTIRAKDNGGTANGGVDTSAPQTFNITINKPLAWHNSAMPLDVVGPNLVPTPDGIVVGGDAVAIINFINAFGAGTIFRQGLNFTGYLDTVDNNGNPLGNNSVDPNDALAVINRINAFGIGFPGPEGEGESARANGLVREANQQTHSTSLAVDAVMALLFADDAEGSRRTRRRG